MSDKMGYEALEAVHKIIKEVGAPINQKSLFAAAFNRIVNLEAKVAELQSVLISIQASRGGEDGRK